MLVSAVPGLTLLAQSHPFFAPLFSDDAIYSEMAVKKRTFQSPHQTLRALRLPPAAVPAGDWAAPA